MSSTTPSPRNYNPSKPVFVCRNYKPSLGHEDDDQVMLLHDKSYNKLEDNCSNSVVVLQGSANLVPRGHGSDGNNDEVEAILQKDSGRERLKRHREEVGAGRVVIPDKWGKEELLKDWIDYSSFDSLLAPNGLASARKALMAEGRRRRTGSQLMKIGSMC